VTNTYNGTAVNNPTFVQGYVNQAVSFGSAVNQTVWTAYIPFANKSFSIDAWIYPIILNNTIHSAICGNCPEEANDYCFHVTLQKNGTTTNYVQYMGFYGDDVSSGTPADPVKSWVHIAVTFDYTTRTASHYRNGIFLRSGTTASQLKARNGTFQIGSVPNLVASSTTFEVNIYRKFRGGLSI
jgi:hypothetical protein